MFIQIFQNNLTNKIGGKRFPFNVHQSLSLVQSIRHFNRFYIANGISSSKSLNTNAVFNSFDQNNFGLHDKTEICTICNAKFRIVNKRAIKMQVLPTTKADSGGFEPTT